MTKEFLLYLAAMAGVTYAVRMIPFTLVRGKIKSVYIQSFLYYVPYVTLAVMTFPAITAATNSTTSGVAALVVGILVAWLGFDLFKTALTCCVTVFILELFLI